MARRQLPLGTHQLLLLAILALYLAIGGLYATRTPAWQVPDEPAHYNYMRALAEAGALPVLEPGDYDEAYLQRLKDERFPPDQPVTQIEYEDWQPPLYYLLAAPVFAASQGDLVSVRLFTLAVGAGVILGTFALARALFPGAPWLALAAAGFVAFVPQHVAMMAAANNDALAEGLIVLGLWLAVRWLLAPAQGAGGPRAARWPAAWPLGLVLGLAFLTKLSAYSLAAVIGFALLLRARRERWPARQLVMAAAQVYAPAVLLGAAWWVRNLAVYGGGDFLAMQRHAAVVVGQLRTADALAQWGPAVFAQRFFVTTFQSFWGQFGWMGVVMETRVYLPLLVYSGLLAVGLAGAVVARWRARSPLEPRRADAAALLAVTGLLAVAVYLYYLGTFVQFQGRYLYPALPVIGLGAAVGLRQWARWLLAPLRLPARAAHALVGVLPLAALLLMAALDVFALYRYIIPQLARG